MNTLERYVKFMQVRSCFISGFRELTIIIQALYASKIISYAQGFMLLAEANRVFKWNLNFGSIALMWRGGCIIRSRFLGEIKKAFDTNPKLSNLLMDSFFLNAIKKCQAGCLCIIIYFLISRKRIPFYEEVLNLDENIGCKEELNIFHPFSVRSG